MQEQRVSAEQIFQEFSDIKRMIAQLGQDIVSLKEEVYNIKDSVNNLKAAEVKERQQDNLSLNEQLDEHGGFQTSKAEPQAEPEISQFGPEPSQLRTISKPTSEQTATAQLKQEPQRAEEPNEPERRKQNKLPQPVQADQHDKQPSKAETQKEEKPSDDQRISGISPEDVRIDKIFYSGNK